MICRLIVMDERPSTSQYEYTTQTDALNKDYNKVINKLRLAACSHPASACGMLKEPAGLSRVRSNRGRTYGSQVYFCLLVISYYSHIFFR